MITKKNLLSGVIWLLSCLAATGANAQIKIGGTPGASNPNALLQLGDDAGTTKGLLLPRVALTSTTSFAPLSAHVAGMHIYNTATTTGTDAVTPGEYYNDGNEWVRLTDASSVGSTAWLLSGNSLAGGEFIGTTNNTDLIFKRYNVRVGLIGTINTFIGTQTGLVNTSGADNVAVGDDAFQSNTTGSSNVAVGGLALQSNTTGGENVAVGLNALYFNTAGGENVAVGVNALQSNINGNDNVAVGMGSLLNNASGIGNVAIGYLALHNNTIGSGNVAMGMSALFSNTTGTTNTAIGFGALQKNIADNNTALGYQALINATAGGNTAVGYQAGITVTTGINNVLIGGAGTATVTTGNSNIFITNSYNTTGAATTGDNNIGIGTNTGFGGLSNTVIIGNSSSTSYEIYGSWTNISDRRMKHDIQPIGQGLSFIEQLKPVEFVYNQSTDNSKSLGFIAQDVQATMLSAGMGSNYKLVNKMAGGDTLGIDYTEIIPILTKAIQEQQAMIQAQQSTIKKQQQQMDELKVQIKTIDELKAQIKAIELKIKN
jgi:hypothetical protein